MKYKLAFFILFPFSSLCCQERWKVHDTTLVSKDTLITGKPGMAFSDFTVVSITNKFISIDKDTSFAIDSLSREGFIRNRLSNMKKKVYIGSDPSLEKDQLKALLVLFIEAHKEVTIGNSIYHATDSLHRSQ